jgi:hypothetical protein
VRGRIPGYGGLAALLVLLTLAMAAVPVRVAAEVASSVTLRGSATVFRDNGDMQLQPLMQASLDLDSRGNKNVKGYFQLDSFVGETVGIDIPQAYIKVRLPWFRLTLGKTRVSWGDGFAFNAGDVVFGGLEALSGDLSGSTLRSETAWMGVVYVPLGAFSFLEIVALPYGIPDPEEPAFTIVPLAASPPMNLYSLSGGIRGAFKLGRTTLETGYYATGREPAEHRPYVSLHGHLLVDWNLSAAMAINQRDPDWEHWGEFLGISAGMFHLINLGLNRTLSFRLEAAIRPGQRWQEATGAEAIGAHEEDPPVYGIELFPEIAFSPTDTVSLQLRSLISPVDLSTLNLFGVSWNIYQGLTIFSYLSLPVGDGNDLYRWNQDRLSFWTAGLEFIY